MNDRQLRLYWSSGTGNSRRAMYWIAEKATSLGIHVLVEEAGINSVPALSENESLGLCYPTHGFAPSWSILKFAGKLPHSKGSAAFVVATRAGGWYLLGYLPGFAGLATWSIVLLLWLKGYRVRCVTGLDMPSNWFSLHPGMNSRHAEFWLALAKVKASRFAECFVSGKRWIFTPYNVLELVIGLACAPISFAYLFVGRFYLAKLFFASGRCTGCGNCASLCPHNAIEIDRGPKYPYWNFRCESCMRCAVYCPARAIEACHGLALCVAAIVFSLPLGFLLRGVGQPWATFLNLALESAAGIGLVWIAYDLFQRALRFPSFQAIAFYTSLTHWYRRYHEPQTTIGDFKTERSKARAT